MFRYEVKRGVHSIIRTIAMILAVAVAAAAVGGCSGATWWWPERSEPAPPETPRSAVVDGQPMITESERPSELGARKGTFRLQITFEVLRVDLPVLDIRHSLKIWNHVDETQAGPRLTALLARNGLRIGTARTDAWPALRVLFESNHAKSLQTRYAVQSGAPLSLRLREVTEPESLFEFQRDGHVVGRTFDRGVKFLHIDYALDPIEPTRTVMKVTPELRKFGAGKRWQEIDGRLQEVPQYEGRTFTELSAELSVGPGEFLVIGPSETATLESLVGSRFLTVEENNVTYETVICLTPKLLRVAQSDR